MTARLLVSAPIVFGIEVLAFLGTLSDLEFHQLRASLLLHCRVEASPVEACIPIDSLSRGRDEKAKRNPRWRSCVCMLERGSIANVVQQFQPLSPTSQVSLSSSAVEQVQRAHKLLICGGMLIVHEAMYHRLGSHSSAPTYPPAVRMQVRHAAHSCPERCDYH